MQANKDISAVLHGVVNTVTAFKIGVGGPYNVGLDGTPGGSAAGMPGGVSNPLSGGTPRVYDSSFMVGLQALLPAVLQNAADSRQEQRVVSAALAFRVGGPYNVGLGGTPGGSAAGMPGGVSNALLGGTPVFMDKSFIAGIQALSPAVLHNSVESPCNRI